MQGLIPGQGNKILHAMEQLSPGIVPGESLGQNKRAHDAMKILCAAT